MIEIPIPPSTNQIWRSYRGRVVKSAKYKKWLSDTAWLMKRLGSVQHPVAVKVGIVSGKGWRKGRDLDNILKPVLDALVASSVIEDDSTSHVVSINMEFVQRTILKRQTKKAFRETPALCWVDVQEYRE